MHVGTFLWRNLKLNIATPLHSHPDAHLAAHPHAICRILPGCSDTRFFQLKNNIFHLSCVVPDAPCDSTSPRHGHFKDLLAKNVN